MRHATARILGRGTLLAVLTLVSCGSDSGLDDKVTTLGTVEVTAQLLEIPQGAIFKRDLYNYATILKYKVLATHRGQVKGETIFVAQYNPFKPRSESADRHVKNIGGNLARFQAGAVHRMAMEVPLDDFFMGGVINKYFGQDVDPIYFAVWTNAASAPAQ